MSGQRGLSDEEVAQWLEILRSGDRDEKIRARENLAQVCLSRGMLPEAVELLELNARDGVSEPALFRRLASLYREVGRSSEADEADVMADSLRVDDLPSRQVSASSGGRVMVGEPVQAQTAYPEVNAQPPRVDQSRRSRLATAWIVTRYILLVPVVALVTLVMVVLFAILGVLILNPDSTYYDGLILTLPLTLAFDIISPLIIVGLACFICPSRNKLAPIIITSIYSLFIVISTLISMNSHDLVKPPMFYLIDVVIQESMALISCFYIVTKYSNSDSFWRTMKRIAFSAAAAVIGFIGAHIIWFVMGLLAYIPVLGATYAWILWSTDLWWGWIGSRIGLRAVDVIAILAAIKVAIDTWENTSQPTQRHS